MQITGNSSEGYYLFVSPEELGDIQDALQTTSQEREKYSDVSGEDPFAIMNKEIVDHLANTEGK